MLPIPQHHPPRLFLQGRSLSARESHHSPLEEADEPQPFLGRSTSELDEQFAELSVRRSSKRLLPTPPSQTQQSTPSGSPTRFRKNRDNSAKRGQQPQNGTGEWAKVSSPTAQRIAQNEGPEGRRRAFREGVQKCGGRGEWRSMGQTESCESQSQSFSSLAPPPLSFRMGPPARMDSTCSEGKPVAKGARQVRVRSIDMSSVGSAAKANGKTTGSSNTRSINKLCQIDWIDPTVSIMRSTVDASGGEKRKESRESKGRTASGKRISSQAKQIIQFCIENARGDISTRILSRIAHKRTDFSVFSANLTAAGQWPLFVEHFRNYMAEVLASLHDVEKIRVCSMKFGADQVDRRVFGFKADFFATMANALATECVFLDGAAHPPTDAIEAWAELVEVMFSAVRDGYYSRVRHLRRSTTTQNQQQ